MAATHWARDCRVCCNKKKQVEVNLTSTITNAITIILTYLYTRLPLLAPPPTTWLLPPLLTLLILRLDDTLADAPGPVVRLPAEGEAYRLGTCEYAPPLPLPLLEAGCGLAGREELGEAPRDPPGPVLLLPPHALRGAGACTPPGKRPELPTAPLPGRPDPLLLPCVITS